ncbi:MAG: regulatory protein RecX [Candidatus Limnocylindria bacterium]
MARSRRSQGRSSDDRPAPDLESALAVAERFLATRPRTRDEVVRRLHRAGASQAVIDDVVTRLERLGYVDDAAFARYWVEQRDGHAPRGRRALSSELRRLGVNPADVDDALSTAPVETDRADAALARHLRGADLPAADPARLARALSYLRRRGFDYATARDAVRRRMTGGDSAELADGLD